MPTPPTTLTHIVIQQTIKLSPDNGETLDFSHRNLCEVTEEEAKQLAFPNQVHSVGRESTVTRSIPQCSSFNPG
jgi:hypothetical protein